MELKLKNALAILGLSATGLCFLAPTSTLSMAPQRQSRCFSIPVQSPASSDSSEPDEQVWCYRPLDAPAGATLVYSIDSRGRSTPELSFMVEEDGTLTHTSLLKGERTIHRLRSGYNPFNIPLTPPPGAKPVLEPASAASENPSEGLLRVLSNTDRAGAATIQILSEGMQTSSVSPDAVPWRGFWFPFSSGRLHNGSDSPLAKFDRFVKVRTGTNPGAQAWEASAHGYTGTNWEGHCNGWAAASVLRKEPTEPWTDPLSGIRFSVSDLKGIDIESSSCVNIAFFGSRFTGGPGEDRSDINPVLFHNTISYYLGELKKPVLMDLMSSPEVQNSVVSGYQMDVKRTGRNEFKVATTLKVHFYDEQRSEEIGPAPAKDKVFVYKLWTNDEGDIMKGAWLSGNPDFLWIPLSYKTCSHGNPKVTEAWVKKFGRGITLPW